MKTVVIASAKNEIRQKIKKLLYLSEIYCCVCVSSYSEISDIVSREKEGIIILASVKPSALSELDRILPNGWDIIAILPPGVPQPFYSSGLTVLNSPVSAKEFSETIAYLMSFSVFKKTNYGVEKDEVIQAAKKLIMQKKSADENSAHRYLQKKSMETSRSLFETAKYILKNGL